MSIFVFEGPNGAGKSTLIAALAAQSARPTYHIANGPSEDPLKDYTGQLLEALTYSREGVDVYIDRFNFGEQVYPDIFGRPKMIDDYTDDVFTQIAASLGVHWFVLIPPVYRLIEGLTDKDELPERGTEAYEAAVDVLHRESIEFSHIANHHRRRWTSSIHILRSDLSLENTIRWVEREAGRMK